MSARLIDLPGIRKRLLASIAEIPAGEKLSIPRLRDGLISQMDVIAGIDALIAAGKLDPLTLRPPEPKRRPLPEGFRRGQSADGELAAPLFDAIDAERKRRGLSIAAASREIWGNEARIYRLLSNDSVRRATADKIRAWLGQSSINAPAPDPHPGPADPPRPKAESGGGAAPARGGQEHAAAGNDAAPPIPEIEDRPEPSPLEAEAPAAVGPADEGAAAPMPPDEARPAPIVISGADLAAEIDAYLARSGMAKSRFGWLVFGRPSGLESMRSTKRPAPATIRKVRAFIANPPADALSRPVNPSRPKRARAASSVDIKVNGDGAERARIDRANRKASDAVRQRNRAAALERINAGLSSGKAPNVHLRITQRELEREIDEKRRAECPIEQAKTKIRRATRLPVFAAEVSGGPKGKIYVGRKLMSERELLKYAEELA